MRNVSGAGTESEAEGRDNRDCRLLGGCTWWLLEEGMCWCKPLLALPAYAGICICVYRNNPVNCPIRSCSSKEPMSYAQENTVNTVTKNVINSLTHISSFVLSTKHKSLPLSHLLPHTQGFCFVLVISCRSIVTKLPSFSPRVLIARARSSFCDSSEVANEQRDMAFYYWFYFTIQQYCSFSSSARHHAWLYRQYRQVLI